MKKQGTAKKNEGGGRRKKFKVGDLGREIDRGSRRYTQVPRGAFKLANGKERRHPGLFESDTPCTRAIYALTARRWTRGNRRSVRRRDRRGSRC